MGRTGYLILCLLLIPQGHGLGPGGKRLLRMNLSRTSLTNVRPVKVVVACSRSLIRPTDTCGSSRMSRLLGTRLSRSQSLTLCRAGLTDLRLAIGNRSALSSLTRLVSGRRSPRLGTGLFHVIVVIPLGSLGGSLNRGRRGLFRGTTNTPCILVGEAHPGKSGLKLIVILAHVRVDDLVQLAPS